MADTVEADAEARLTNLLSPRGRELLGRLRREAVTPENALAVGVRLRAEYPAELVRDALAQHELRTRAAAKFGRAADMFFTRAGLEQASSEAVARHRASRYPAAGRVADLCCGIGGDLIALAADHPMLAVARDPVPLRMARANAEVHGVAGSVTAVAGDVRDAGLGGVDAVFIDPARRTDRRRMRAGDSEPPLGWCLRLADRVARVGIKAAPGLPHEVIPPGWELEFVAVGRELKEAVAWSPALATAARRATILPAGHTLARSAGGQLTVGAAGSGTADTPTADTATVGTGLAGTGTVGASLEGTWPDTGTAGMGAVEVRPPGEFLFDPNPAVTRAGLVQELARMLSAWKIDEQIAFLSTDSAVHTPFARALRVIDSAPWNQKRLPERLRALDIGAVDIRRRGLAGDVEQLHRRLKLSGSRRATLVMTRVNDQPWGLVCLDVSPPALSNRALVFTGEHRSAV
jgi:SAM-dependent methyltransferase